MARIVEFLNRLAEDPSLEASFEDDPRRVMESLGLDEADRELILSGDIEELRRKVQEQGGTGVYVVRIKMAPGP